MIHKKWLLLGSFILSNYPLYSSFTTIAPVANQHFQDIQFLKTFITIYTGNKDDQQFLKELLNAINHRLQIIILIQKELITQKEDISYWHTLHEKIHEHEYCLNEITAILANLPIIISEEKAKSCTLHELDLIQHDLDPLKKSPITYTKK
jgi:hypothetical protein